MSKTLINSIRTFVPYHSSYSIATRSTVDTITNISIDEWYNSLKIYNPSNYHRKHLFILDNIDKSMRRDIMESTPDQLLASIVINNISQADNWERIEPFSDHDIYVISNKLIDDICNHLLTRDKIYLVNLIIIRLIADNYMEHTDHVMSTLGYNPMPVESSIFMSKLNKWINNDYPCIDHNHMIDLLAKERYTEMDKWEHEWYSYVKLNQLMIEVDNNRLINDHI